MAGSIRVRIETKGFKETRKLLRGNGLYAEPLRRALEEVGQRGEAMEKAGAPVGVTGKTRDKTTHRVSKAKVPRYVVIRTTARRKGGFAYPRWNNFAPKSPNKGFFTGKIGALIPQFAAAISKAGDEIQANWTSGRTE